ncbi:MAG: hypothetical protein ACUVX9_12475, partial [Anaerolineae bacterium]
MREHNRHQRAAKPQGDSVKGISHKPEHLGVTPEAKLDASLGPLSPSAVSAPVGHLADARVKSAQRRALAGQIARLSGNRHIGQLVGLIARVPDAGPGPGDAGVAAGVKQPGEPVAKGEAKKEPMAASKEPIDLLREELGDVFVDEAACLGYIRQLGAYAATVRNSQWMMGRMAKAFNAQEMFTALMLLQTELKWSIYWLQRSGEAARANALHYSFLVSPAPLQQVLELMGWPEMMNVVRQNYKLDPLFMFPPLTASNVALAQVFANQPHYVDWVLEAGPAPRLLSFILAHNPLPLADALVNAARWDAFLAKMPKGMALTAPSKAQLYQLAKVLPDAKRQSKLFELRFDVETSGGKSIAWDSAGIMRAWQVLSLLPAADVEGNPKLQQFLRMGTGATSGLSDMTDWVQYWYNTANIKQVDTGEYTDPTDPMRGMKLFDTTIIHEIGHAVDGSGLRFSRDYPKTNPGGGWVWHTPESAVDGMIAASPWTIAVPKAPAPTTWGGQLSAWWRDLTEDTIQQKARQACIRAATSHKTVQAEANAIDKTGQLWALIKGQKVVQAIEPAFDNRDPWMNHGAQTKFGDRYYHEGYRGSWYSYLSDRYDAKLSKYQFRDPRDWFA